MSKEKQPTMIKCEKDNIWLSLDIVKELVKHQSKLVLKAIDDNQHREIEQLDVKDDNVIRDIEYYHRVKKDGTMMLHKALTLVLGDLAKANKKNKGSDGKDDK